MIIQPDVGLCFGLTGPNAKYQVFEWFRDLQGLDANHYSPIIHPTVYLPVSAILEGGHILEPRVVISSNVNVGTGCIIGTGAMIRDGVSIGGNSMIGIGSVVTKDIPEGVVAYGNPCKVIGENEKWKLPNIDVF